MSVPTSSGSNSGAATTRAMPLTVLASGLPMKTCRQRNVSSASLGGSPSQSTNGATFAVNTNNPTPAAPVHWQTAQSPVRVGRNHASTTAPPPPAASNNAPTTVE
ncbi:MAG: hypothetical protein LBT53_00160 [Puniceicoccales bacterium]|nr:hypothetical protein [Puniceicoccales bacterium]